MLLTSVTCKQLNVAHQSYSCYGIYTLACKQHSYETIPGATKRPKCPLYENKKRSVGQNVDIWICEKCHFLTYIPLRWVRGFGCNGVWGSSIEPHTHLQRWFLGKVVPTSRNLLQIVDLCLGISRKKGVKNSFASKFLPVIHVIYWFEIDF